jgi:RNase P/RNase MRP subunit POP5
MKYNNLVKLVTLKVTEESARMLRIIAAIQNKKQYVAFEEILKKEFNKIDIEKVRNDDG